MSGSDLVSDQDVAETWLRLRGGKRLTVMKLAPDGVEVARYPGEVVSVSADGPWAVLRAEWTYRNIDVDGLSFCTGDSLLEWFSPSHWFNAFAVFDPQGTQKGWYGNVTYPAWLDARQDPELLVWHDLFLDLVAGADGSHSIRDKDELEASGIGRTNPVLHQRILAAAKELGQRFARREPPFATPAELAGLQAVSGARCTDDGP